MSIVVLKRKTQAKYNNSSVGMPGFSLNGAHRNQGYVGQDSRGRTLVHTPMKGATPKGSGGCCGTYNNASPIQPFNVCSVEDPNVVKQASLNTHGMIQTKYAWVRRPFPHANIKPDDNHDIRITHSYLEEKKVPGDEECQHVVSTTPQLTSIGCNGFTGLQKPTLSRTTPVCNLYTKSYTKTGAVSSDIVMAKRTKMCSLNNDKYPAPMCRVPFIGKNGFMR